MSSRLRTIPRPREPRKSTDFRESTGRTIPGFRQAVSKVGSVPATSSRSPRHYGAARSVPFLVVQVVHFGPRARVRAMRRASFLGVPIVSIDPFFSGPNVGGVVSPATGILTRSVEIAQKRPPLRRAARTMNRSGVEPIAKRPRASCGFRRSPAYYLLSQERNQSRAPERRSASRMKTDRQRPAAAAFLSSVARSAADTRTDTRSVRETPSRSGGRPFCGSRFVALRFFRSVFMLRPSVRL
jgi:hypothetical protein